MIRAGGWKPAQPTTESGQAAELHKHRSATKMAKGGTRSGPVKSEIGVVSVNVVKTELYNNNGFGQGAGVWEATQ
jgi:hypothetical protein